MKKTIAKSTKTAQFRYYFLIFLSVFFISGISDHSALAINMTVEAIEDAGLSPGKAFAEFTYNDGTVDGTLKLSSAQNPIRSINDVGQYVSGFKTWWLRSAGNIWSQSDTIVGESLTGLSAGTYRISVVSGAFEYDAFDWNPDYRDKFWWQLCIMGFTSAGDSVDSGHILGSTKDYGSDKDALAASLGKYLDIYIPEGGSLVFWIWDTNSLDNAGSLTFNVTPIPEPATVILVGTGMLFLVKRFRRSSSHR